MHAMRADPHARIGKRANVLGADRARPVDASGDHEERRRQPARDERRQRDCRVRRVAIVERDLQRGQTLRRVE